jgi:hypothetical protein
MMTRTIELAAMLPLGGLVLSNVSNSRAYYEIDTTRARAAESIPVVGRFARLHQNFADTLQRLGRAYEDAYHNSHIEYRPVTRTHYSTDANGNTRTWTTIEMEPHTVWTWDEPSSVPSHHQVFEWSRQVQSLAARAGELEKLPIVDGRKLSDITVEERSVSKAFQGWMSGLIYTGEAVLLLGACLSNCIF